MFPVRWNIHEGGVQETGMGQGREVRPEIEKRVSDHSWTPKA